MAVNAIDANFRVFPVVVAICEMECKDSWWPGSSNRFCVKHIFANVRAKHRGNTSTDLVFKAVKSTNKAEFDNAMKEIKDRDLDAYN
ncbi:hypothetical protein ACOSQ4_028796 [Xanthoceras sorbifolium]